MSLFGNDAIVISRYGPIGGDGNRTVAQVYIGASDFQIRSGEEFVDAAGDVHTVSAVCIIDASNTGGALPAVLEDDVVTFNGAKYSVLEPISWAAPVAHLELLLRRGPQIVREKRA